MKESFAIIPASNAPLWIAVALVVFFVVLGGLFAYIVYSSRNTRFQVTPDGLRITGTLYGQNVALDSLVLENARVLDLTEDKEYRTRARTNGVGLPGYSAGWFRLRNGEKALVFVTSRRNVVYLPTRGDFSLLLSVGEPHDLLAALRSSSPPQDAER